MLRSAHRGEHTAVNYERVNRRIAAAEIQGGRDAVLQELRAIGLEKTAVGRAIGTVVVSASLSITP